MRSLSRLIIVLTVAAAALVSASSVAFGASQLIYSDEFNSGLDTASWAQATPWNTEYTIGELEYYDPANASFANGMMTLRSDDRDVKGFSYTSGIVTSLPRAKFSYGYFEIRAKLPKGPGIWPAFWLTNDSTLEIDGLEMLGDRPTRLYQTLHRDRKQVHQGITDGPDYSAGFHTYGIDWQPTYVKWYVDGVLTTTYNASMPSDPLWICLNTAVGGSWPGSPTAATTFPVDYSVDYVRVYDTKPAAHTPVVVADSYATDAGVALRTGSSGVLGNDTDALSHPLVATLVTPPANGTLALGDDGSFVYVPKAGFSGADSFSYVASDGTAVSPATAVSLTVIAPGPAVVTKPVVTLKRRAGALTTYKVAGVAKPVSAAGAAQASIAASTVTATAPVIVEVRIQRYTAGRWRAYATRQMVNPSSAYSTLIRLRAGTFRARTVVSRGGTSAGTSAWSTSFTVR